MQQLEAQVKTVEERINQACKRVGRNPKDIKIVTVTKYVTPHRAEQMIHLGYTQLGENRWPDCKDKLAQIQSDVTWHFIGHLQSRKVRDVVKHFHYIHSLDRLSLAKEIQKRVPDHAEPYPCFIQVNVSGEESKFGLQPDELSTFAKEVAQLDRIRVVGLMTMAPYESNPDDTRQVFRGLRLLQEELNQARIFSEPLVELSMGMSNDFEVAIEEGATCLRLGTVLVGKE